MEEAILSSGDEEMMAKHAETFLRGRLAEADETAPLIRKIIDEVTADRTMMTVEDVADRFGLSPRMLQRMFGKYVGASPKWVIRRYRLLEAADQMANGQPWSWPQLAAELGYYDQSHFIKDFKSIIGLTPEEYYRKNGPKVSSAAD